VGIEGLTAINDSPTLLGALTTLTATIDAGSNVTYVWNFGDDTSGEGAVVTHTYPHTGPFTARVTAVNPVGYMWATTVVTITDVPITGLSVVNDSPTWIGAATTLTATVATGSNVTYAWDFGDGESGSGPVVSHVYPSVGTYTAVVTASNSANAVSDTSIVTITVAPVTGLTVVNDSPTLLGDSTTFTATVATGAGVTYTWAFGDGAIGSGPVVTHTYPSLGFYTATVTATNEFNAISATSLVTITDGSITGLAARNSSPTRIGSATQLTATVATGIGVSYDWAFGDGETGSGALVSHTYSSVGTYTAIVTATNRFNVMTDTTVITITDVPVTRLSATNDGPTTLGQSTTFTANISTGTNVTYSWTFGDGETGYGRVVSHTYLAGGTYTAIVTARNSAGAWTASTQVKVAAHIYLPLVLKNWSPGAVTPTPTPTTPPPQDVYVLPNYSYYEAAGGPLYIVGEAQNDGSTYAVLVDVPIHLLDSSGNLLRSYKVYTSLDLPAGEKSCFSLAVNAPPANWASVGFGVPTYYSFANRPWLNLVISGDEAYQTDFTYKISGSVRNDESVSVTGVLIEGAVYNSEGKIVGCRLVPPVDRDLAPGQSSPFELFYGYDGIYDDIDTYRLQADGLKR
jgi:PKD repeat protein